MASVREEPAAKSPVAGTKFYIPRWRPGQVPRTRLVTRLARCLEAKLTLVSAPPGFGKTTLLAEWLASAAFPAAWLSLDPGDDHPATFWARTIAALQTVEPGIGKVALAMLEWPQPPPAETVLALVLNEAAALPHELVLVLDDYHVIEDAGIHAGIAFLVDHLPPRMHLVVASRADPVLPLARLRARGELVEIRAADLRFTADEAAAFLNGAMGLALSAQHVAALEARTEGWIAALQLAALSTRGRDDVAGFIAGFAGDDRYIVDYLVEEVLQRQPERVRRFLLETSILNRLSGPLCDAVTGQEGGKATLEALERGNLFVIPLDDRRRWYRYHHLFADVLQAHLLDEDPGRVHALHRRASEWFERNGERDLAIRHAFAGDDFELAANLVELAMPALRSVRQEGLLLAWLARLPEDVVSRRPVLGAGYAGALLAAGDLDGVELRLRNAERWLASPPGLDASGGARPAGMVVSDEEAFLALEGWIAIFRAGLEQVRGNQAGTLAHARHALTLVAEDDQLARGAASALLGLALWATGDLELAHRTYDQAMARVRAAGYVPDVIASTLSLAEMRIAQGRLGDALATYERALKFAAEQGEPVPLGTADLHVGISEIYRERDELDIAYRHLLTSRELGEAVSLPEHRFRWHLAMAAVEESRGDPGAALERLDEAERLYLPGFSPNVRPIPALRARLWVRQGRLAEAEAWVREQRLSVEDERSYLREFEHITLATVLFARSRGGNEVRFLEDAAGLLAGLLAAAEHDGRAGSAIGILVVRALVHHARGDTPSALAALERALALAEPEGYVRMFVDEGTPMRDLLREAVAGGIGGARARRLLAAFAKPAPVAPAVVPKGVAGLAEPLTPREIEILRLVAAGMQNQAIADHLVISLSTVKRHIANTYGKLEVGHRTEAVARANELNLL